MLIEQQIFTYHDKILTFSTIEVAKIYQIDIPENCSKIEPFSIIISDKLDKNNVLKDKDIVVFDCMIPDKTLDLLIETGLLVYPQDIELTNMLIKDKVGSDGAIESLERLNNKIEEHKKKRLIQDSQTKIDFFNKNDCPPVPEDLEIEKEDWELILASVALSEHALILGPKGAGKTWLAKNLAMSLNRDFHRFNFGAAHKAKSFFCGSLQAKDGSTILVESEFLRAFTSDEPSIIFADELTRTPSQAANYAMTIFENEDSYIYIEELGKKVYKGKGVRFIAAGNVGNQYTDTRTQDGAFWDRFNKFTVDYLDPDKELHLLSKRTDCPTKLLIQLIKDCNNLRQAEKSGELSTAISTRQAISAAKFLGAGFSYEVVWNKMLINNFINGNNDELETAKTILTAK